MRLPIIFPLGALAVLLAGCSPALDWREMPLAGTALIMSFPCKPSKLSREVPLGGLPVDLAMHSCDAAGATFAVGHAQLKDPALVGPVLQQWREATLRGLHVRQARFDPFLLAQGSALPQSLRLRAEGSGADGRPLAVQGAWFARGTEVYMALVYAEQLGPQATESFFAGLRFR